MEFVIVIAVVTAVSVGGGVLGSRRSEQRATAVDRGETVRVPARIRGDRNPYGSGYARGKVEISPDGVVWTDRRGSRIDLLERGVRPRRVNEDDDASWRNGFEASRILSFSTIHARDDAGTDVEIRAHGADVDTIVRTLRARLKGTSRPTRPSDVTTSAPMHRVRASRVPLALVAVAALVLAVPAYFVVTGETVTATITEALPDDTVAIEFTGPWDGQTHTTTIDTYDEGETVGSTVDVLATRWPLTNDAGRAWELWAFAAIVAVPVLIGAAVVAWRDHRRRRRIASPSPVDHDRVDDEALDDVPRDSDVTFDGVTAYLATRAEAEEWPRPEPGSTAPSSPWRALGLSGVAQLVVWVALFPALVGGFALAFFAVPATLDAVAMRGAQTQTTTAKVTEIDNGIPLMPYAYVEFTVGEDLYETDAAVTGGLSAGDQVQIRYDVDDPFRVVVPDHDGTARDFTVGWLVTIAALGALGYLLRRQLNPYRTMPRLLDEPAHAMRYALTRDDEDGEVMLLFDPVTDAPPAFALELLPGAMSHVARSGSAQVHGELTAGARVVPTVGGAPVWPSSDLIALDEDTVDLLLDPLSDLGERTR